VIQLGAVHIIESLRPGDLPTGEQLRNELVPLVEPYRERMVVHFWRETTRADLLNRLALIAADVRLSGRAPVVHIETHGDAGGLQVTSNEYVPWPDLKIPFTLINITCRLNLLVILGACDGAGLLQVIQAVDRAPVWGLIGPRRPVTESEVDMAHRAFYRSLLSARDGGLAWRAMNAAITAGDAPFSCYRAEDMFRLIVAAYLRDHCSDEQIAERVRRVTTLAREAGLPEREKELTDVLRDHRLFFDRTKRHFFFADLCPDHVDRFPVSLEECSSVEAAV
jgi:hypothetical protein